MRQFTKVAIRKINALIGMDGFLSISEINTVGCTLLFKGGKKAHIDEFGLTTWFEPL